jgi:hypothetical protein
VAGDNSHDLVVVILGLQPLTRPSKQRRDQEMLQGNNELGEVSARANVPGPQHAAPQHSVPPHPPPEHLPLSSPLAGRDRERVPLAARDRANGREGTRVLSAGPHAELDARRRADAGGDGASEAEAEPAVGGIAEREELAVRRHHGRVLPPAGNHGDPRVGAGDGEEEWEGRAGGVGGRVGVVVVYTPAAEERGRGTSRLCGGTQ